MWTANPLFQGLIVGLALAVPVGPIALMCIRRTIAEGKYHGIVSGMGVATGDSFYAAVAVLGITAISGFVISNQELFRVLASVLLIAIGGRIFFSSPPEICAKPERGTYFKDYLSMVAIALANPLTLLFFIGILPGFGIVFSGASLISSLAFVVGIFSGSTIWWMVLCGMLGSVRTCIGPDTLGLVNRASGLAIACIGAGLLVYGIIIK